MTLAHIPALLLLMTVPAFAINLDADGGDELPQTDPALVEAYGADPLQFGELYLPNGKVPFPVAIVLHGGCWTKGVGDLRYIAPLAAALAERGIATWNVEYRQIGDTGGGWPGTFLDWGAAADHLRDLAKRQPLDLTRVAAIGHSAGAPAALWIAARGKLPKASAIRGDDPLPIHAAVALDGPLDLAGDKQACGKPVVTQLMGGMPRRNPERYAQSSPYQLLPLGVPQYLVVAKALKPEEAARYRDRAEALVDKVEILTAHKAGHFDIVAPGTKAWSEVENFILSRAFLTK